MTGGRLAGWKESDKVIVDTPICKDPDHCFEVSIKDTFKKNFLREKCRISMSWKFRRIFYTHLEILVIFQWLSAEHQAVSIIFISVGHSIAIFQNYILTTACTETVGKKEI